MLTYLSRPHDLEGEVPFSRFSMNNLPFINSIVKRKRLMFGKIFALSHNVFSLKYKFKEKCKQKVREMIIFYEVVASLKIIPTSAPAIQLQTYLSICGSLIIEDTYNRNINFLQPGRCVRKQQLVPPQGVIV